MFKLCQCTCSGSDVAVYFNVSAGVPAPTVTIFAPTPHPSTWSMLSSACPTMPPHPPSPQCGSYAVVPAVVWANVLLDILYYPVIVLMWRMTAVPDRSFGGGLGGMGRLLGTRNINPGVFHNPSSSLHAQRKHKGRAGGSPTGSGPGSPTSPGGVHATLAHVGSSNALLGSRGPSGGASPTAWSAEEKYRVSPARSGARGGHAGAGVGPAVSGPQNFAASPGHVRSPKVKVHPAPTEV
jgi:hypothetical protein